jgi:hypothetical protein
MEEAVWEGWGQQRPYGPLGGGYTKTGHGSPIVKEGGSRITAAGNLQKTTIGKER